MLRGICRFIVEQAPGLDHRRLPEYFEHAEAPYNVAEFMYGLNSQILSLNLKNRFAPVTLMETSKTSVFRSLPLKTRFLKGICEAPLETKGVFRGAPMLVWS